MTFDYSKVDFANLNSCTIETNFKLKYHGEELRQLLHDKCIEKHNELVQKLRFELIEQNNRIKKLEKIIHEHLEIHKG